MTSKPRDPGKVARQAASLFEMEPKDSWSFGKYPVVVKSRSLFAVERSGQNHRGGSDEDILRHGGY